MSRHIDHQNHDDRHEVSVETLSTPPLKILPAPVSKRMVAGLVDSVIVASAWFSLIGFEHQPHSLYPIRLTLSVVYLLGIVFAYYFLQEGLFAYDW